MDFNIKAKTEMTVGFITLLTEHRKRKYLQVFVHGEIKLRIYCICYWNRRICSETSEKNGVTEKPYFFFVTTIPRLYLTVLKTVNPFKGYVLLGYF